MEERVQDEDDSTIPGIGIDFFHLVDFESNRIESIIPLSAALFPLIAGIGSRLSGKQKDKTSKIRNQKSVGNIYTVLLGIGIGNPIGNRDRESGHGRFFLEYSSLCTPAFFIIFSVTQYFRCHHPSPSLHNFIASLKSNYSSSLFQYIQHTLLNKLCF